MDNLDAPAEVPEFQPSEMPETGVIYISAIAEPQMKRRKRQGGRKGKGRKAKVMKAKPSRKSRRRRRRPKVTEERIRNPYYLPRYPYY